MAGKIFVNYRRGDEPGFALALYGRLEQSFASEQLFMDVEGGIHAGDDFVKVLETQVAQCDVLLALIGQGWLSITDENGARRLDNPDDFVRIEIESAMRLGKRVVPVLLNKAEMPRATDLPEPLKPLSRRNAVRLTQERFKADVQGLITAIETALREDEAARAAASTAAAEAKLKQQQGEAAKAEEVARAEKERTRLEAIAGLSPEQIAKAEELANWDFIKASRNAQDLRDHLARFPSGVTARFAQAQLEELAWDSLGDAATLQQLGDFLAEFPHGAHANAAAERRAALEQEQAVAQAANEQQRRETEAWAAASAAGNVAALTAFLKEWPQGQHAEAARARIKELKGAPTRRWLLLGAGGVVGSVAAAAGVGWTLEPGTLPWRLINDRSIRTFTRTGAYAVAISPDARNALSVVMGTGVGSYALALWDIVSGNQVSTFAGSDLIRSIAFSPDGRAVVSAGDETTCKLWEVATGKLLRTFSGHSKAVLSVAFSPDGRTLLSGSEDESLKLWDVATGKELRTFRTEKWPFIVAFSPDGRTALSGGIEGLALWELATGRQLRTFGGRSPAAVSPDGRTILSGTGTTGLKLWDIATGRELRTFDGPSPNALALSKDGRLAVSGHSEGRTRYDTAALKVWDVATGKELHTFRGHQLSIRSVAVSGDGRIALSGSDEWTMKVWDLSGL